MRKYDSPRLFSWIGLLAAFMVMGPDSIPAQTDASLVAQFVDPPGQYGMVPFFWWNGEPLTAERMAWSLDRLRENGFSGVNINYTHTTLGHAYRGSPPLFSDAWWQFWETAVEQCRQRGMTIGFDDYLVTHGNPDLAAIGSLIRRESPEVAGLLLRQRSLRVEQGGAVPLAELRDRSIVAVRAYRLVEGQIDGAQSVPLDEPIARGDEQWTAPEGSWYVSILFTQPQPFGAMNPLYAQKVIEYYFEPFERHSAGAMGDVVTNFFQDELTFGGSMPYWCERLPEEFRRRKGYDLMPELTALFADVGPRTRKIRLDYYDVAVALMEDAYFRPIYQWCRDRGVVYGHDQCSRADLVSGVTLYGDYFRTLRWYQAPGTDRMPELTRGKVCSSIAQLYDRPRVWLEGYHSEGWGVRPQNIRNWDRQALMFGYNQISYHSFYYSTRGGWWDWAPGGPSYRQPYWPLLGDYFTETRRLCFLLAQGKHRCDVAVLFPTATVQADMTGTHPGQAASKAQSLSVGLTEELFRRHGLDFDYIDDQSLARAETQGGLLRVAGGEYRVLILPGVEALRQDAVEKIVAFHRAGGVVLAVNKLPAASDRVGSSDPQLESQMREVFGICASELAAKEASPNDPYQQKNDAGGVGCLFLPNSDPQRFYPGGFQGQWLWYDQLAPSIYCKAVWKNPKHPAKKAYSMKVLGDNQFVLYRNGERIASSDSWQDGWTGSIELADGDVLTVEASDQDGGRLAGIFLAVVDEGATVLSSADLRCTAARPENLDAWRRAADLTGLQPLTARFVHPTHRGGEVNVAGQASQIAQFIGQTIPRDFTAQGAELWVMHRRIDTRDLYAVFNPASTDATTVLTFRATGVPVLWDAATGLVRPIARFEQADGKTTIETALAAGELRLIVFSEKPTADPSAVPVEPISPADTVASEVLPLEGTWDFCVEPVLDNRFGDFHNPATPELLGVEARRFRYYEQFDASADTAGFTKPAMDDSAWPEVTAGFGPRFWVLGPIPAGTDTAALERELAAMRVIDPERPIRVGGAELRWSRFDYSLRFGMENDPMLQQQSAYAIHGPIGYVPDEFIHLQGAPGSTWYLWTSAEAARPGKSRLAVGTRAAFRVWWNGRPVLESDKGEGYLRDGTWSLRDYPTSIRTAPIELPPQAAPLLVRLTADARDGLARAFVQCDVDLDDREALPRTAGPTGNANFTPEGLVASRWLTDPPDATYDVYADRRPVALWYRLTTPPGAKSFELVAHGRPEVWVAGEPQIVEPVEEEPTPAMQWEGARHWRVTLPEPVAESSTAVIRLQPQPGFYGGAALPEPIRFQCGPGCAPLGDWASLGMACYSGIVRYGQDVALDASWTRAPAWLEIDAAAAAEVFVNGRRAGVVLTSPGRIDVAGLLREGENRIEIRVANTLANHYSVGKPCGHRYIRPGQTRSGLFSCRLERLESADSP